MGTGLRAVVAMIAVALATLWAGAAGAVSPDDPLKSVNWTDLKQRFFGDARLVFDDRVKVTAPTRAEDSMNVPVGVDAEALGEVEEVVVIADLNPIIKVLQFRPLAARASLSFRVKLQQATPVRAIARTRDGVWHAGGVWVDATGGGCTAPSVGRTSGNWADTLGQVKAKMWSPAEAGRLRLSVMHPMDTGLAPGIPAFYIEKLSLSDASGVRLMDLETFEPVSENPVFTFDFAAGRAPKLPLLLSGVDNNGNRIQAKVAQ